MFSPQSSSNYIGYVIICVSTNLFSNIFTAWNPLIFSITSVVAVASVYLYWRIQEHSYTKRLAKALKFSVKPKSPKAAKGLMLLLSPYSPRNPAIKSEKVIAPLIETIIDTQVENLQEADFDAIDLFNSNLVPQIKAVEYHMNADKLRDVWLITSKNHGNVKGSETSADILNKYLRFKYGKFLKVYYDNLSVKDLDYNALSALGEKIFQESGYTNEFIVADITGGTKMMSVALAMACVKPGLKMQYMDSTRDWQGNPLQTGDMKPVGIDVFPIIYG
ncbi:MAG: hypothetical protein HC903_24215 [Methylacidiphilales bacterium]|nr:hypothetical protein [Candidatus Methylacidiphilales bacterium]